MRAALVLMMLVAAACGSDAPGMRLEVVAGNTHAVTIELYLGSRPCVGCDGRIAPKGVGTKLAGEVWLLDGDKTSGTPATVATLENGSFVFDLKTPDPGKDARIAHILVVGYNAQGQAVGIGTMNDAPIYHAATEWYRLTLGPVTDAPSSDAAAPKGERIYVWHRFDKTAAACVGYEKSTDEGLKRLWFVPEDDTDCDAIDLDCDLYAYYADGRADINAANCMTAQFPVPNTTGKTCLLGGPACIDGEGRTATCGPVGPNSYCLPDAVCANSLCATNLVQCIRDGAALPIPRIHCDIPFDQQMQGMPCASTIARHAEIDLKPLLALPNNPATTKTTCKSIKFADVVLGQVNVMDRIVNNTIVVKPDPLAAPCSFGMLWAQGSAAGLGGTPPPIVRMMVAELENGNRMLLPIELQFRPTACTTGDVMSCTMNIAPSDSVTHCAQQ